jgi:AcrR family transcriptional regulator
MLPDAALRRRIAETTRRLLLGGVCLRQATMDRIATELRISKKTVYQQFSSKEDLLATLLAEHLRHLRALGRQLAHAPTAVVGLARLSKWQAAQVSRISLQLVADLRTQFPGLWELWWAAYQQQLHHLLAACLRRGMKEQLFRPNLDVEVLVRLLLARLDLVATGQVFPPECFPPHHVYTQLMQHFLRGILRLPTPAQG